MSPAPHPIRIKSPGFSPALVAQVLDDALAHGTCVLGLAGLQGSGKSTLAAQLVALARTRGLRATALSLDDVYLTRGERLRLARDVHPLLATRGPPGTHALALACDTLDALRAGTRVRLPRFDKASDRRLPPSRWRVVEPVDFTVFEGWCLCVPAEDDAALVAPINALERNEDVDGRWRRYCNTALRDDYPALWSRIDRLWWLQPPGFEQVYDWRWQQELTLLARRGAGMSRAQVDRFVQHFERVSRQALRCLPARADRTHMLDADRRPVAMHAPMETSGVTPSPPHPSP